MSARSFGNYDLPSALADLIDNSIKARAKAVRIDCHFNRGDPLVRIVDDGHGMTAAELLAAMRPASTNPERERARDDLGRFGWGLKSASFSQCRRLTVISRKEGNQTGAEWNLRDVDQWRMGVLSKDELAANSDPALLRRDGTQIVWTDCDRLSEDRTLSEEEFNRLIVRARNQLALVFHRYLKGEVKGRRLAISVNGLEVIPYDPFYTENPATQPLEFEELRVGKARISIKPYILPHYSKLALAEYDKLAGEEGFLRNQGFYVYRQHRLIISGTWFRLVRHGELSQLVRIGVDIPIALDALWKITVDKSDAQLPSVLRKRLEQIVDSLRRRSAKVIRSKGGRIGDAKSIPVWQRHVKGGEVRYSINREHPLVATLYRDDRDESAVTATLRAIEQGIPVTAVGDDIAADVDRINQISSDPRELVEQLDVALAPMLLEAKGNIRALLEKLRRTEPFAQNWKLVEDHLKAKEWIK